VAKFVFKELARRDRFTQLVRPRLFQDTDQVIEVLFDIVVPPLDLSQHTRCDDLVERFTKTTACRHDDGNKPANLAFEAPAPTNPESLVQRPTQLLFHPGKCFLSNVRVCTCGAVECVGKRLVGNGRSARPVREVKGGGLTGKLEHEGTIVGFVGEVLCGLVVIGGADKPYVPGKREEAPIPEEDVNDENSSKRGWSGPTRSSFRCRIGGLRLS
jgi:hypothetical protein